VTRITLEEWIAELQRQPYAAASIRRKIASLRAFFSYLLKTGYLTASPLTDLRIRLGGPKRLTRVVPRQDLRAIIQTADSQARRRSRYKSERIRNLRNALMLRLLCVTGIRVGELVSLQMSDVHPEHRAFTVHGKGNRERLAFVTDPKTARLFDRFLKQRSTICDDQSALFIGFRKRAITTDIVRKILKKLCRTAGTASKITPHMLRHTAATSLLENGADLRIVQEFLGHDSIRSTERYTHVASNHLLKVLRRANPLRRVA
jgi:integrase/recombinase XerD